MVAAAVWLSSDLPTASAQAELRGVWVTRFEWPHADPATAQSRINAAMSDLADHHFNAVFFQVRGQADVLYPSPYEVWSPLIGGSDPGWDPLAYAISSAHAHDIEFHAYINTHTCWQSSALLPPQNANHVFYAHCNAADPSARDWLIHDASGNPVQFHENNYVWIAPGVPGFQAYLRQQVLYVVENYDVDGVHFDRIRTPNSGFSYDPISMARFRNAQSNPDGLDFHAWTADQITRNVRDIYAAVMAVRPQVKLSAAVFSNPLTAPASQHQAALAWAQAGAMDILVPMMYFTGGAGSTWDDRLQQWLAGSGGRHVVAGHITSQGLSSLLEQIALTRVRGGQGNVVFSWGSFGWWDDYLAGPYADPAGAPTMSWKTAPATGIIYGYILEPGADPVVDAQVTRSGDSYTALSSGDGFYSLLLVPPGSYTLQATHIAHGATEVHDIAVAAGDVIRRDIMLPALLPPVIRKVDPDPDTATVDQEYTRAMEIDQGSVDSWSLVSGPTGADVDALGRVRGWTPTADQAGTLVEFIVRAANAAGSDDETWHVQVGACEFVHFTGFEGYQDGTRVLFNQPRYSGSTSGDLAPLPNVSQVTTAPEAFSGDACCQVSWQFLDTDPQRWMRLTTYNGPYVPNPTVAFDRPIRIRLRLDSGTLRFCIGIRETGTEAPLGDNGGTTGTIEWVGAATDINGAPQGILLESMPEVWQTFVFDPRIAPVHGMTGDGQLQTLTNRGVLEHLAFSVVDDVGPFTVYIDDIHQICNLPAHADFDADGDVDEKDLELLTACVSGPAIPHPPGCEDMDFDGDNDVDQSELAVFQRCYGGEDRPGAPGCPE